MSVSPTQKLVAGHIAAAKGQTLTLAGIKAKMGPGHGPTQALNALIDKGYVEHLSGAGDDAVYHLRRRAWS